MALDLPLPVTLFLFTVPESLLVKTLATTFQHKPITSTIPFLFGFNVLVWAFYAVLIYPFFLSPLRHLPEPKSGYPHYARSLVLSNRYPADEYFKWMQEVPNDGLLRYRGLFNSETIIPTNTQAHADILVHKTYDFAKPEKLRAFLRRFIGDGLINIEGDEHKFQRKAIGPLFSFRYIKELYPIFWTKSLSLMQNVAEEIESSTESMGDGESGVIEISRWSTKVTLDIIGLAGLGFNFNALKNHNDPLVSLYEDILEPTTEKKFLCLLYLYFPEKLVRALPWEANHQLNLNTDRLRDACRKLMAEKAKKVKEDGDKEQKDILSGLLRSNLFSDEMLVDQLLTFLAAGHETTSTTFTWGCYLLATHPAIQTRLREEVRIHLSTWLTSGAIPTATDLPPGLADALENLPYLNAVCNEISRLYPAVPIVTRIAVRATTIAGHTIPAGTIINLAPWAINRSPAYWGANAGAFKPERWIDGDGRANNVGGALNNYAQLTFFHGPRSCVGQRFSMAELRALVACFAGTFEWQLEMAEEEVVPAGFVTVKPKYGLKLRIKKV